MGAELCKFSYSRGPITRTSVFQEVNLASIDRLIIGDRLKERTEEVRKDLSLKSEILPYIMAAGTFSERKLSGLLTYSKLIGGDIDHCDELVKDVIAADNVLKPVLTFTSPSGKGVKFLVYVPGSSPIRHAAVFHALNWYIMNKYSIVPDLSGSDIPRACFLCHDPDAYYNPEGSVDCDELFGMVPPVKTPEYATEREGTSPAPTPHSLIAEHRLPSTGHPEGRPSDELNRIPAVHDRAVRDLINAGWKRYDQDKLWTKPGKSHRGCSAIYNLYPAAGINIFKVFSDKAYPFQPVSYTDTGVINLLEFGGRFKDCIRELAGEYLR